MNQNLINSENSHNWIAIIVSLIAILSTSLFTWFQYDQAREHNKKSLSPLMNVYIFNDKTSGYKLQNVGVGPAKIYGVKARNLNTNKAYLKWNDLVGNGLNYSGEFKCSDTMPQTAQAIGVERPLITLFAKQAITKSTPIELTSCYCSVYDDCWTASNKSGIKPIASCNDFTGVIEC